MKHQHNLLIICDLDRVAVDCEERFAQAAAAHKKGSPEYWRTALDPAQLVLDVPQAGALAHLAYLYAAAALCYVTSRPSDCHAKTVEFLSHHGYPCPDETICRPARKGLTTARFKGLVVRALSYGLPAAFIDRHFRLATNRMTFFFLSLWSKLRRTRKVVLFVDDSEKNRQAIAALGLVAYIATGLDEAVAWLRAGNA